MSTNNARRRRELEVRERRRRDGKQEIKHAGAQVKWYHSS